MKKLTKQEIKLLNKSKFLPVYKGGRLITIRRVTVKSRKNKNET
jgi:hypothetical protein